MPMISYAQNREDVLLNRAFPGPVGFYIDVGAADPVAHSVTKWFYDRGWTGVNVEPSAHFYPALAAARPRDTNLNVALADAAGEATFYDVPDCPGWATLDEQAVDLIRAAGLKFHPRPVHTLTLAEVCERYVRGPVDFLKIDVEGAERAVLVGADFTRWRPRALVIEATETGRPVPNHEGWEPLVLAADYLFAAFDGLNRFYVRAEDRALLPVFQVPPNLFDDYVPAELVAEQAARDRARSEVAAARAETAAVRADLDRTAAETARLRAELAEVRAQGEARDRLADELRAEAEEARRQAVEAELATAHARDAYAALEANTVAKAAYSAALQFLEQTRAHLAVLRQETFREAG